MIEPKRVKLYCLASFILGCSLTLLAVTFALSLFTRRFGGGENVAQVLARARSQSVAAPAKPGAWGILEPVEVPLANTDGIFPDEEERMRNPRWFFEKYTETSLARFLSSCDLRSVER